MVVVSRRDLLKQYVGPACIAYSFRHLLTSRKVLAATDSSILEADQLGILALLPGFKLQIVQKQGDRMTDGFVMPGLPDGMGVFPGNDSNTCILLRNHELNTDAWPLAAYSRETPPQASYDPQTPGGVTRLVWDLREQRLISSNLALAGTLYNCSGGKSPWGWMSCEESVVGGHGYVFLVAPEHASLMPPNVIKSYGRFNHEACVVEPTSRVAYLTEDRLDGSFYRFLPEVYDQPFVGKLQALKIKEKPRKNLGEGLSIGQSFSVDWVDIKDADPKDDSLRTRAQEVGAAIFCRAEGLTLWKDDLYISCTAGGPERLGQIFKFNIPSQTITLVAQSPSKQILNMPDNITIAPWGDLYMAEDGEGVCHIRILTPNGKIINFARNLLGEGEFSGVCFSPDYSTLFCNLQVQGLTLAITGPFHNLAS